ncbi:hypothetical protein [Winogradskyella sp.]|uniref:hypothetical protein n=1 Tax=Winogradskyella sp. TaxID=1883156 RepID=UPI0026100C5E|nr:hypothetical protein [Winogradskyella sp.]
MKKISYLFAFLLIAVSCSKEEVVDENAAFSSDANPVFTGEVVTDTGLFDKVFKIYGNTHRAFDQADSDGKFYELGFVVTENSQNPGEVYLRTGMDTWERMNEGRASNIAGFWDTLSKNNSKDARIIQAGTNPNKVYLFFGNNGRNYKAFRVDRGEVLKEHNQPVRTLPGGFKAGSLFFHNTDRADFPANWLGVKGKRIWNFGSSLSNTPSLIPIRAGGFGGADLNKNIRRIQGDNSAFVRRIDIERINGTVFTVQKERNNGINFYKD